MGDEGGGASDDVRVEEIGVREVWVQVIMDEGEVGERDRGRVKADGWGSGWK